MTETATEVFWILRKTWLFDTWPIFFLSSFKFHFLVASCGDVIPPSQFLRERVSHLEFSHENQSSSPLCLANFDHLDSVALSWGNYCKARSRTIFGKYLGIFRLCGYLSPLQHSTVRVPYFSDDTSQSYLSTNNFRITLAFCMTSTIYTTTIKVAWDEVDVIASSRPCY